ncbi:MAG: hypothetical protein AAGA66_11945 [Bacteroidota bacterium]
MALKTFVKISNVSSLSDARYCAGMMVDVIGFNIDPLSEDQLSAEDFSEITEWIAGVQFAGEFYDAGVHLIKDTLLKYQVDVIQINDLNMVEEMHLIGKPIIFRMDMDDTKLPKLKSMLSYLDELVDTVLIKCDDPQLYDELDAQIGYYNGNIRLLKGYGVTESNHLSKFPGIELEATEEDQPGFKDYGEIMDVLEEIEE